MAVQFAYGSQSQYDKQVQNGSVISDAVYFINDSQSVYRGSELIARTGIRFVSKLPETLEPDTIYAVSSTDEGTGRKTVDIYVSNSEGSAAQNATDATDDLDIFKLVGLLPKLTSEDVKAGKLDEADDSTLLTAGALKQALDWTILSD